MQLSNQTILLIAAGVGGILLVSSAKARAAAVIQEINPVNPDNLVNRSFLKIYGSFTDGQGTLGTDIYELLHPNG